MKRQLDQDSIYISVVIPVYRAERILPVLYQRLNDTLEAITDSFEIILVDDRSPDNSWEVLEEMVRTSPRLIAIRLSRNFGQHYATTAGLDICKGEWTIVMDCDLQERPEDIPRLLDKALEGYDIVLARRIDKKHTRIQTWGSQLFWYLFRLLSGMKVDSSIGSFRIMNREVVDAYCSMRENSRVFGGMIEWLGFSSTGVDVEHCDRLEGTSSYNLWKLIKLAGDGILSFSNRPLYASIILGSFISILAGFYGMLQIYRHLFVGSIDVQGWVTTVTLISFIGGLILMNQGIMGLYIGRIYDQTKARPIYVLDKKLAGMKSGNSTAMTIDRKTNQEKQR